MIRYLATYGLSGYVGIFAGVSGFRRGEVVEVQSPRGREAATILEVVDERVAAKSPSDGEIVGSVTQQCETLDGIWPIIESTSASWPMTVADAELLLDGTLIVHVVPYDDVDLTGWLNDLSNRLNRSVRLLNLAATPTLKEAGGCGKEGCGSGGGCGSCGSGCGTGSCSKGKVKTADEMTDYFRNLRQAMESRRTNLV